MKPKSDNLQTSFVSYSIAFLTVGLAFGSYNRKVLVACMIMAALFGVLSYISRPKPEQPIWEHNWTPPYIPIENTDAVPRQKSFTQSALDIAVANAFTKGALTAMGEKEQYVNRYYRGHNPK